MKDFVGGTGGIVHSVPPAGRIVSQLQSSVFRPQFFIRGGSLVVLIGTANDFHVGIFLENILGHFPIQSPITGGNKILFSVYLRIQLLTIFTFAPDHAVIVENTINAVRFDFFDHLLQIFLHDPDDILIAGTRLLIAVAQGSIYQIDPFAVDKGEIFRVDLLESIQFGIDLVPVAMLIHKEFGKAVKTGIDLAAKTSELSVPLERVKGGRHIHIVADQP